MPKPVVFACEEAIVEALRSKHEDLQRWFDQRRTLPSQIVYHSVGANTFRAFQHMPRKPSRVFRTWASQRLADPKFLRTLCAIPDQKGYDRWLKKFSNSLVRTWNRQMGSRKALPYGPSRKLPNLLMKEVVLWRRLPTEARTRLVRFLHVPLDRYSLVPLRVCDGVKDPRAIGAIPATATMGFVRRESQYKRLQELIQHIAQHAQVPRIYFDVLTWNTAHAKRRRPRT